MSKKLLSLFLLLFHFSLQAQNLVPNPSFEVYDTCPYVMTNVSYLVDWQNFGNTPDYYNSCDSFYAWDVPHSGGGYQFAATGGGIAVAYQTEGVGAWLTGYEPANESESRTKALLLMRQNLIDGGYTWLDLESEDISALEEMAGEYSAQSYQAKNILAFIGGTTVPDELPFVPEMDFRKSNPAIEKTIQQLTARIYPNPNSGTFIIILNETPKNPVTFEVFNLLGQSVWKSILTQADNSVTLPERITAGVYAIHLSGFNFNQHQIILIAHE